MSTFHQPGSSQRAVSFLRSWIALLALSLVALSLGPAEAQEGMPVEAAADHHHQSNQSAQSGAMTCPNHPGGSTTSRSALAPPSELGQGAFAAVSEITERLLADPATDWSRVDLDRLRAHLVDMNRVFISAQVERKNLPNGFEAVVRGEGETAGSIQRMLGAHAAMVEGEQGWSVEVEVRPDGAQLRVTTSKPDEVQRLQALGFSGFLASGHHHGTHHLALATGGRPHHHSGHE